jgi:peptidase E
MHAGPKPMFLLADSQPLFRRAGDVSLLDRVRDVLDVEPARAKAAYLGASNGDVSAYYALFQAAMRDIDVVDCKHVRAEPDEAALAFVAEADIVLLAGGDPAVGWRAFQKAGLVDVLRNVPGRGAILAGVSAGAVQIGMLTEGPTPDSPVSLLSLLPYVISPHQEPEWASLANLIRRGGGQLVGIGIPTGGAVIAHPDRSIESFRKAFTEVVVRGDNVRMSDVLYRG